MAPTVQPAETIVARPDATLALLVDHPDLAVSAAWFAPGAAPAPPPHVHAPACGLGDYLRGRNPVFDRHDPPPDGGRDPDSVVVRAFDVG